MPHPARPDAVPALSALPALLVCGIEEQAMLSASLSLQLGLPGAVAVRHTIDAERAVLTRTVSDVTGLLEREQVDLAHVCVTCAVREDVVPTLERLAATGRWSAVVACLPVTAEADQVCRVLRHGRSSRVAVAGVVAALDGGTVIEDLLGDSLLDERGLATSETDRRGTGEVVCAMVEYADVVGLTRPPSYDEQLLLGALARPGAPLVTDPSLLDAAGIAAGVHHHDAVEAWVATVRRAPLDALPAGPVWRLDLRSDRPFHPVRFRDELAALGGGPRRSRGCFWLPTRPGAVCVWDAAGGQASVGTGGRWSPGRPPLTRIVVTGLDDGADEVERAFRRCLLSDAELAARGSVWEETWDGLEPWLGPVDRVA